MFFGLICLVGLFLVIGVFNAEDVNAITHPFISEKLADNVGLDSPDWNRFWQRRQGWGGRQVRLPIDRQFNTTAAAFTGTGTRNIDNPKFLADARYDLKEYFVAMSIADKELALNSGKEQVINFTNSTVDNARKSLVDTITTDLWSTNASDVEKSIGIGDVLSITTTLGEVSVADFAAWIANIDSTTTTLTIRTIHNLWVNGTEGLERPSVAFAQRDVFAKYASLLQNQQRFMTLKDANVSPLGDQLMFFDVPVIQSSYVTGTGGGTQDNLWVFLNEKYIMIFVASGFAANLGRWKDMKPQQAQIANSIELKHTLACNNRRFQSAMTNIDPDL